MPFKDCASPLQSSAQVVPTVGVDLTAASCSKKYQTLLLDAGAARRPKPNKTSEKVGGAAALLRMVPGEPASTACTSPPARERVCSPFRVPGLAGIRRMWSASPIYWATRKERVRITCKGSSMERVVLATPASAISVRRGQGGRRPYHQRHYLPDVSAGCAGRLAQLHIPRRCAQQGRRLQRRSLKGNDQATAR